jgi:hypothetical protein
LFLSSASKQIALQYRLTSELVGEIKDFAATGRSGENFAAEAGRLGAGSQHIRAVAEGSGIT